MKAIEPRPHDIVYPQLPYQLQPLMWKAQFKTLLARAARNQELAMEAQRKRREKKRKRGGHQARQVMICRKCGCTDADCSGCIQRTGAPCYWIKPGLCSACVPPQPAKART